MRIYRRYTECFELPDDLVYLRFRQRDGYEDAQGRWVTSDGPGERTGPFGKWHIVAVADPPAFACKTALPLPLPESAGELAESPPADPGSLCQICLRTLRTSVAIERFVGEESDENDG